MHIFLLCITKINIIALYFIGKIIFIISYRFNFKNISIKNVYDHSDINTS
jgi:hypothetical protein